MNGVVALAQKDLSSSPQVGDLVTVEILLDEKVGKPGDEWQIGPPGTGLKWVPSGGLTLSAPSLRVLPSEGNTTKLAVDGMVHQPGPLATGEILLRHVLSGQEIRVATGSLSAEAKALAATQSPPPWTLPAVPFGGWNHILIGALALLLLAALALLIRKLLKRVARKRRKNHLERSLQSLHALQKYARSKHGMQQEEWKKFSFELAGIIRKFSDENFRIDTSDLTDREFLADLRMQPRAKGHVDSLAQVLSTIDEVRYGKKALDATVVPNLLLETRRFLEGTFQPPEGEGR